jgi:hypothetical protein
MAAMQLRELVAKYLELAGEFGKPVALAEFGLSREETERLFSALDEDYHISRFLAFSHPPPAVSQGQAYQINGFLQTHLSVLSGIREVL